MLKTNNNQVKEYFNNYVKSNFDGFQVKEMTIEYNNYMQYEYKHIGFSEFLTNYCGHLPLFYSEEREILKCALQETEEQANKYSNDKVQALFFMLCDRAFSDVYGVTMRYFPNGTARAYII